MAKKAELLEQAHKLKLEVGNNNTIAEIEEAIKNAGESIENVVERETVVAKAGKRSEKALKEAEDKEIKEARKADENSEAEAPKSRKAVKPTRSRLERRSKGYKKVAELIEKDKEYSLAEAVELALKTNSVKFDAAVELHVRLNVDPKHADQNIRDNVVLPAGTGKTVKVAVFADEDDVKKAKAAGADIAGGDEFLQQLDKGEINFDVLVATPKVMARLGKYARILGPKGLMPNPKSGTVAADVAKAVKEAKAGKVEYRVDSTGIVHLGIGKVSFKPADVVTNAQAVLSSIKAAKPASVKGPYVQSIYLTTTMGPSVKIQPSEL
jgi:ribosomal protein L1